MSEVATYNLGLQGIMPSTTAVIIEQLIVASGATVQGLTVSGVTIIYETLQVASGVTAGGLTVSGGAVVASGITAGQLTVSGTGTTASGEVVGGLTVSGSIQGIAGAVLDPSGPGVPFLGSGGAWSGYIPGALTTLAGVTANQAGQTVRGHVSLFALSGNNVSFTVEWTANVQFIGADNISTVTGVISTGTFTGMTFGPTVPASGQQAAIKLGSATSGLGWANIQIESM